MGRNRLARRSATTLELELTPPETRWTSGANTPAPATSCERHSSRRASLGNSGQALRSKRGIQPPGCDERRGRRDRGVDKPDRPGLGLDNYIVQAAQFSPSSAFTIETLQKLSNEPTYIKTELNAKVADTVDYEIIVKNTGSTSLKFGALKDSACESISPAGLTRSKPAPKRPSPARTNSRPSSNTATKRRSKATK